MTGEELYNMYRPAAKASPLRHHGWYAIPWETMVPEAQEIWNRMAGPLKLDTSPDTVDTIALFHDSKQIGHILRSLLPDYEDQQITLTALLRNLTP